MPTPFWTTAEALGLIQEAVKIAIPQWQDGLKPFQLKSVSHSLAGIDQLLIAPTGSGKTAAFYAPVLVLQRLHAIQHPTIKDLELPKKPLCLILTPLNEVSENHVSPSCGADLVDDYC